MTLEERKEQRARFRAGLRVAIAEAMEEHRRAGRKIAVWRDGKVMLLTVDEAMRTAPETK